MVPAVSKVEDATNSVLDLNHLIINKGYEEQQEWLCTCGDYLTNWGDVGDIALMNEAKILYTIKTIWPEMKTEATHLWDYDYYKWARRYIKRRGPEPTDDTIRHRIRVWRDLIAEPVTEIPKTVFIPKRNGNGKPIDPKEGWKEEDVYEEVPLNLSGCEFSKLLKITALAKEGPVTPEIWSAVADPFTTCSQLDGQIRGLKNGTNGHNGNGNHKDDFRIYEQDGIIYGYQNGRVRAVMQLILDDDSENDPIWQRTVQTVMRAVGSKTTLNV